MILQTPTNWVEYRHNNQLGNCLEINWIGARAKLGSCVSIFNGSHCLAQPQRSHKSLAHIIHVINPREHGVCHRLEFLLFRIRCIRRALFYFNDLHSLVCFTYELIIYRCRHSLQGSRLRCTSSPLRYERPTVVRLRHSITQFAA